MTYRPTWDLSTIPSDQLFAETGRRRSAMRKKQSGGRAITKHTPKAIAERERVRRFREKQTVDI